MYADELIQFCYTNKNWLRGVEWNVPAASMQP